ncbi:MAG: ATP-binding protein [Phycisphaerales bacterium]|nr:ATP-binding protein [Phycisphaerales bacterium]
MPAYEKLGQFYLGKRYDLGSRTRTDDLLLYDSKDLVTHAVCVGMTGSGKTGLCLGVLEEAAIDGIPAIVVDPKGDLANLLLTFPGLKPEDFRPWINEEDARKKGVDPDTFARQQAELWARGLGEWGQDGERIARLKASADFAVYTPGSGAGLPVSILRSFACPPPEQMEDGEILRERIATTATSLLGLLKIEADPMTSREHILLAAIISDAWSRGQDLDIPALIQRIQQPPFTKLGVMEVETVYPAKERFGLAMALNNLVASPGFAAWLTGEPLDIGAMLFTPEGRPRVSIFSIAHLGDAERMFFVALLMNQVLGWTRAQSGTTSLRALVYMDEIAGYFPPVANPPSKQPMLTMMKQGRAFGVGMVLATQNPVDLDYKGLANAGTWFIGRLQTDRDKQRVLDGLEGAATQAGARFDRSEFDRMLSALGPRVFLMNNVHEDHPEVFETRWCLTYLRGPLTRQQIRQLTEARGKAAAAPAPAAAAPRAAAANAGGGGTNGASGEAGAGGSGGGGGGGRPVLPAEIPQYFLPCREGGPVVYRPMLLGSGRVYYSDAKSGVDQEVPAAMLVPFGEGPVVVDWDHAEATELTDTDVEREPAAAGGFAPLPAAAAKPKSYEDWKKSFADTLYRTHKLELFRSAAYKAVSKPGESEGDFRARLAHAVREQRDAAAEKLRQKYAPKMQTLGERLRRAQQAEAKQREQASAAKVNTALSIGAAILGAFMGRKTVSAANVGRAATAARAGSRAVQESGDVGRAEETVQAVQQQLSDLQAQFDSEQAAVAQQFDTSAAELETVSLKPKKTNIQVRAVLLVWAPHTGSGKPAWA